MFKIQLQPRIAKVVQSAVALGLVFAGALLLLLLLPLANQLDGAKTFVTQAVRAATPTSYRVQAPLRLTQTPSLVLTAGRIMLPQYTPAADRSTPIRTGNLQLTNGRFILNLNPQTKTSPPVAEALPGNLVPPILLALSKFGFATLKISNSDLVVSKVSNAESAASRTIHIVSAILRRQSSGVISAQANLRYRGQTLGFSATFTNKPQKGSHGLAPFSFELKGQLLTAKFDGLAAMSKGLQFNGMMVATSPNLRQLARWLKGDFPDGHGLRDFKVSGKSSLVGSKLSFENAVFHLDNNSATGGLTLDFGKPIPSIEGTLAADHILLDAYFLPEPSAQRAIASELLRFGKPLSAAPPSYNLALPTLRHVNADIRLSAKTVQVAGYQMKRAAAAVSLQGGKLLADIAEIELASGRGIGQITADMSGQTPWFAIRSKFEDIDISEFSSRILGASALSGLGHLVVNLDGSGATGKQIIRALSGKVQLSLPDGGYIGIDPKAMVLAAKQASVDGWKSVQRATAISRMQANFSAQNGIFNTEVMEATSGDLKISCSGNLNLARQQLDLSVSVSKIPPLAAPAKAAAAGAKPAVRGGSDVLSVSGSWTVPVIRLEQPRKKAGRPTSRKPTAAFVADRG